MPFNSGVATVERKRHLKTQNLRTTVANARESEKGLLKIAPALPVKDKRSLYVRSHSSLNANSVSKKQENAHLNETVVVQTHNDGLLHVSRIQEEKEAHPDRICLDRRGLSAIPVIEAEPKLRLLSLQHNLISNLDTLRVQQFPSLVFLDIYDNQLEKMQNFDHLENLRVLLMGKNRIKKIEGLENLSKIEVLDLHGNQITQVGGLGKLKELKVLNLAGNQIRNIGTNDLFGLHSLQELNLRRNRLRKLLGFAEVPNLSKLFISNNDLQCIDDISSLAKSTNVKEVSIDNNPIFLESDCISFLVSYLPQLTKLNAMVITEQVRKAAMAWRRNKEITNATYMELTSDISLNYRREEVISNARTNWELLRSQTRCLTNNVSSVDKTLKDLKPDSDFVLTSLAKVSNAKTPTTSSGVLTKSKTYTNIVTKVPLLADKKNAMLNRTSSQDTDNSSPNTSNSSNEMFKLPPILVPILNKMEQKNDDQMKNDERIKNDERLKTDERVKNACVGSISGSLSSVGPNVDSSISSLTSEAADNQTELDSSSENSSDESDESDLEEIVMDSANVKEEVNIENDVDIPDPASETPLPDYQHQQKTNSCPTETSSVLSVNTTTSSNVSLAVSHNSSSENSSTLSSNSNSKSSRNVKSAIHGKSIPPTRNNVRASTAKAKKPLSPNLPKDREQGGDYLIEICGRHLNIYGQGALRFIDKPWNVNKAHDVNVVKFNYVNFNSIAGFLGKLKHRFPNVDNLFFKETNIVCLGQLNALSALQGLHTLNVDPEGNPICEKNWHSYAVYRLSHWGLKVINNKEISEEEVKGANTEYQSLNDLILWSMPEVLLQPLLMRLRIDVTHNLISEQNAKKWLLTTADPELRSVVCKEVLQWKKGTATQEEVALRQKAKHSISGLLKEMTNAMDKLVILEKEWPNILHNFVQNTLFDYSQLDLYMKQKIQEFNK